MKKVKKILFITLICALSTVLPANAKKQETVNLDITAPTLTEKLAEAPVDPVEDKLDKINGTFIQAPKNEIQPESRSGLVDYDPSQGAASPKFFLYNVISKAAKDVYELEVEQIDNPVPLLSNQLTFRPESGPLEKIHVWGAIQMDFSETLPERGQNVNKFDVALINPIIDGTFRGGKENFRIMLDPTHRHSHLPFMQPFIQDFYIETTRIPHTRVLLGNSRPGVGVEGAQSPYNLAFINRSQISRNLANIRKFGVRVRGDYSLMDYDTGFYSSSTNFTDFFPGYEYDAWVNLKPLGKTDGKYGKPVVGAGIQSGEKHGMSYYITGVYAGYEYKKFWTKFEYARANGSNGGSGLSDKRAQGLFVTAAYRLTKKLEILARYDQFDPDRAVNNNNQREYTLGTNYYIKGQALKLIFNYIYCQNDSKADSHRLMMGTQIVL